jgi:hypothetical protein
MGALGGKGGGLQETKAGRKSWSKSVGEGGFVVLVYDQ